MSIMHDALMSLSVCLNDFWNNSLPVFVGVSSSLPVTRLIHFVKQLQVASELIWCCGDGRRILGLCVQCSCCCLTLPVVAMHLNFFVGPMIAKDGHEGLLLTTGKRLTKQGAQRCSGHSRAVP